MKWEDYEKSKAPFFEVIFTFNDDTEQEFFREWYHGRCEAALRNRPALKAYLLSFLNKKLQKKVVKASTCVYHEGEPHLKFPKWWNGCNGKIWWDENRLPLDKK